MNPAETAPGCKPVGDLALRLVRPSLRYAGAFLAMAEEYQQWGDLRYAGCLQQMRDDFRAYLGDLSRRQGPRGLPPGHVPQSEFWLVDRANGAVLGSIRFRHALTPALEACVGHIGYTIRPSARGKGYGKRMLGLLLRCLKSSGWQRVLITCDVENLASARVIEANGGRLEDQRLEESSGRLIKRYWVDLDERAPTP